MSRDDQIDQTMALSTMALRDIAARTECDYSMDEKNRPRPCPCSHCVATRTLDLIERGPGSWRYRGAYADRVEHSPRERRIIETWRKQVNDRELGMILTERRGSFSYQEVDLPSVRDWFVATSVVQWLATNVGMSVLEQAGFKYQLWEEDRKEREDKK